MRAFGRTLDVKFIKSRINPLDFYGRELPTVKIKPGTWVDGGLCPFHDDHSRGSFKVNLVTGAYRCFSCGVSGGDIIDFARALYGLSFVEALKKLADEWGC